MLSGLLEEGLGQPDLILCYSALNHYNVYPLFSLASGLLEEGLGQLGTHHSGL